MCTINLLEHHSNCLLLRYALSNSGTSVISKHLLVVLVCEEGLINDQFNACQVCQVIVYCKFSFDYTEARILLYEEGEILQNESATKQVNSPLRWIGPLLLCLIMSQDKKEEV